MAKRINRRAFLTRSGQAIIGGVAGASFAARAQGTPSANERVTVVVVGNGGMGRRHVEALATNPNCEVVGLCDVAQSRSHDTLEIFKGITGKSIPTYQHFQEVLDRPDVETIFVATPDHWHPLLTILGCQAGKDVYVEKPVCTTVEEGRAMVEAARRFGRIVQAGTQQRSMPVFQKAMEVVHSGRIGHVTHASAWVGVNMWGVGETPEETPRGLDWDLWLGPAPYVPYAPERYFGFMGWHDYARGGQLTNWGVHLMDIVHWGIQQDKPLNVQALGGSYRERTGGDNYETIDAIFEYPGCSVSWEQRHANTYAGKGLGIRFQGTEGQLFVDRATYIVEPKSLGISEFVGEPERSWANTDHHNNFFKCVRTREKPVADIEQGFRSTVAPLLAGIALKEGRKLNWDGEAEHFLHDPQANRHLTRAYRYPWHL